LRDVGNVGVLAVGGDRDRARGLGVFTVAGDSGVSLPVAGLILYCEMASA
jgi:hypothetical protein